MSKSVIDGYKKKYHVPFFFIFLDFIADLSLFVVINFHFFSKLIVQMYFQNDTIRSIKFTALINRSIQRKI